MTLDDRPDARAFVTHTAGDERHRRLLPQNGRRAQWPASPPPPSTVYPDG